MLLAAELGSLLFYIMQQAGVLMAVGAHTALILASIFSNTQDASQKKQFPRYIRRAVNVGLVLIIFSGIGATLIHVMFGQIDVITSPAYVFKWVLIVLLLGTTQYLSKTDTTHYVVNGFATANWYALFILHVIAPQTTWLLLLGIYVLWIIGFMLVWSMPAFVFSTKKSTASLQSSTTTSVTTIKNTIETQKAPRNMQHTVVQETVSSTQRISPAVTTQPVPIPQKPAVLPEVLQDHAVAVPPHTSGVSNMPVPYKPKMLLQQSIVLPDIPAAVAQKPKDEVTIREDVHDPDEAPEIPAMHIMPRTPEELPYRFRPSAVQLAQ